MLQRPNNLSYRNVILSEAGYGGLPKALLMFGETNGTAAVDEMNLAAGTSHSAAYGGGVTLGNLDSPFSRSNLRSALFNGTSGYCLLTDASDLRFTNNFTLEFWFKPPTAQSNRYLLCRNNTAGTLQTAVIYGFVANTIEIFAAGYSGSDPRTGSQLTATAGAWNHVVYTYNGSIYAGYVNGVAIFSTSRTFAFSGSALDGWYIGAATAAANFVNAYLDGVALYNYALAADRIKYHYLAGINGVYGGANGRQAA